MFLIFSSTEFKSIQNVSLSSNDFVFSFDANKPSLQNILTCQSHHHADC